MSRPNQQLTSVFFVPSDSLQLALSHVQRFLSLAPGCLFLSELGKVLVLGCLLIGEGLGGLSLGSISLIEGVSECCLDLT